MNIVIGRISGPCTDRDARMEVNERELNTIMDTIAAVNLCINGKEQWFIETEDGRTIIPLINSRP